MQFTKFSVTNLLILAISSHAGLDRPNVLFISMDDLNDWIGCMGGHPQTRTPNLDRLAASGTLFTNAHCPAPACNPSRTAVFTGISPHVSGLYLNNQRMREILPNTDILPKTFSRNGYWAGGSGKMLHYFIDAPSWDEYFPRKESENPFPRTMYPDKRPVNLPRGGPWQYVETDWAALKATDEEFGGDYLVAQWVSKQLARKREDNKPFFLACGIYRPHEPWFVPEKYFKPFPLESIQLPPGYKEDDLNDLPPEGRRRGPNRYFAHIRKHKQWKAGVQAYLASIHFADAMLGNVLEALENGPHAENTIVVLWSDHGWHLGEKQHWQKFTGWRACSRVPLIIRMPDRKHGVCNQPVSLLSLGPTLLDLCGLPKLPQHKAPSLRTLLKDPESEWPHVALTHLGEPGSYGLSTRNWRYIRYKGGGEELYDIRKDPYEWKNLAQSVQHKTKLNHLRKLGPDTFSNLIQPSIQSLPGLKWNALSVDQKAPPSKPEGNPFSVTFINQSSEPVELFWMDFKGGHKPYVLIEPNKHYHQQTRSGAVWMLAESMSNGSRCLGYFTVGDRKAKAIVPQR